MALVAREKRGIVCPRGISLSYYSANASDKSGFQVDLA